MDGGGIHAIDPQTGADTFLIPIDTDSVGGGALAFGGGTLFAMDGVGIHAIDPLTGADTFLNPIDTDSVGGGALAITTTVSVPITAWLMSFGLGLIALFRSFKRKAII